MTCDAENFFLHRKLRAAEGAEKSETVENIPPPELIEQGKNLPKPTEFCRRVLAWGFCPMRSESHR